MMSLLEQKKQSTWLNIESGEERIVWLTVLYSFFLGIVMNTSHALALSLFLGNINGKLLPFLYIGSGILTLCLGIAYSTIENKISFFKGIISVSVGIIVAISLVWFLLVFLPASDEKAMICIFSILGLVIAECAYLLVISVFFRIFTQVQRSRLDVWIGGAQVLGVISAAGLMPLILYWYSTTHIVGLTLLGLILSILILSLIKEEKMAKMEMLIKPSKTRREKLKNKYIGHIFSVVMFSAFIFSVLFITFNINVQSYFITDEKMAEFLGYYFGIVECLGFLIGIYVFKRVLKAYGVIFALLLLPIILSTLLFLTWLFMALDSPVLILSMLMLAAIWYSSFRLAIYEKSIVVLLQPIHFTMRMWASTRSALVVWPLSVVVMSAMVWIVIHHDGISLKFLIMVLIGLCICQIILLAKIKSEYSLELSNAIAKRIFIRPEFNIVDKNSIKVLREYANSPVTEDALFGLHELEKLSIKAFSEVIIPALNHPSKAVSYYALLKIHTDRIREAYGQIEKMLSEKKDQLSEQMLSESVITLIALADEKQLEALSHYFQDTHSIIQDAAIVGFLNRNNEKYMPEARDLLKLKVYSSISKEREIAATILHKISASKLDEKKEWLLFLMNDDSREVYTKACLAAQTIEDKEVCEKLIQRLSSPGCYSLAYSALLCQPSILDVMHFHFYEYTLDSQRDLIKILGSIKQDEVIDFLLIKWDVPTLSIFHEVLRSLKSQLFKIQTPEQKSMVQSSLEKEMARISQLANILSGIYFFDKIDLLKSLLMREIELCQERIAILLSFLYGKGFITELWQALTETQDEGVREALIKKLSQNLDSIHKEYEFYLVRSPKVFAESYAETGEGSGMYLVELIKISANEFITPIREAAMYSIGLLKFAEEMKMVEDITVEDNFLLREARNFALSQINEV